MENEEMAAAKADLERKTRQWVESAKSMDEIKKAFQAAADLATRLTEERRVDPRDLHEPVSF